ncbi:MAG: ATP-binding protein [Candidatus Ratteibacteria bacterium]
MILSAIISDSPALKEELALLFKDSLTFLDIGKDSVLESELRQPISLLFLDVPLKENDPFTILRQVGKYRPGLPVVVLLPGSASLMVAEALQQGAYDTLTKPIDRERLKIIVSHALEKELLAREKEYLGKQFLRVVEKRPASVVAEQGRDFYAGALRRISETLLKIFEENDFAESLVKTIGEVFGLSRIALFLREKGEHRVRASFGWDNSWAGQVSFSVSEGLAAWLEKEQKIIRYEKITDLDLAESGNRLQNDLELACAKICVPVFSRGKVGGFLALGNKISGRDFSEEDIDFFSFLANYLGLVFENAALYHQAFLKKKEQEMILEHLTAGVIAVNPEGRITSFNQKAMEILAISPEEMRGVDIQKAGSQLADFIWRALKKNELVQNERIIYPATRRPLQVSANLIKDEDESTAGAVLIFSDRTSPEELEKKVGYLERLNFWYQLASSMAHQIKNPLVAIKTFVQLLPDKYQDQEFREKFFRIVSEEVERLNRIASDLFEFSEPVEMRVVSASLKEILESSVEKFVREFGSRIELKRECPDNLLVDVDRNSIEKAFDCILTNSGEAIKENGRICIKAESLCENNRLFIRVDFKDNGSGIMPENISEVFSPFYTTKTKGMGLGLPIAQRIIEDHNGKIRLESVPGKGTVCQVFFPVKKGDEK